MSNQRFEDLMEGLKHCDIHSVGKSWRGNFRFPAMDDVWTDETPTQISGPYNFPVDYNQFVNMKNAYILFYDYYFDGTLPPSSSPSQIVYPVLATLAESPTIGEDIPFFPATKFQGNKPFFHALPISEVLLEPKLSRKGSRHEETFRMTVVSILLRFTATNMDFEMRMLRKVTGFLALVMMQALIKDEQAMLKAFNKKSMVANLQKLADWPMANGYSPPCKTCIAGVVMSLNKRNPHASTMMAMLLAEWEKANKGEITHPQLLRQMDIGLLAPTSEHGFGAVTLMHKACKSLKISIDTLHTLASIEGTENSWKDLLSFRKRYLQEDVLQSTYKWARLINDDYFLNLSANNNALLCGLFAGIISSTGDGGNIQNAHWFVKKKFLANIGFNNGISLAKSFQGIL